jgi:hypothetical protein
MKSGWLFHREMSGLCHQGRDIVIKILERREHQTITNDNGQISLWKIGGLTNSKVNRNPKGKAMKTHLASKFQKSTTQSRLIVGFQDWVIGNLTKSADFRYPGLQWRAIEISFTMHDCQDRNTKHNQRVVFTYAQIQ